MNEKDRIIELVKQNIITMDEALDLLEASQNNTLSTTEKQTSHNEQKKSNLIDNIVDEGKSFVNEINEYFSQTPIKEDSNHPEHEEDNNQTLAIKDELVELEAELSKEQESLMIAQQRLREIEIFAELEDLNNEMRVQEQEQRDKVDFLTEKISQLKEKITSLKAHTDYQHKLNDFSGSKQEFKNFIGDSSEKITDTANRLGEEAVKGGKKFSKFISEKSKEFADNFNMNLQFPWIKTSEENFINSFPADNVQNLDISILNGSLTLEGYEGKEIQVEAKVKFFGNQEDTSYQAFEKMNLIDNDGDTFIFHIKSPKLAGDIIIKVPTEVYQQIDVSLNNGNIHLNNINSQTIKINNKNGNLWMNKNTVDMVTIELINGKATLEENQIETLVYSNLNGDLRIKGSVNNLSADTVNSNFFITKTNKASSNIKVKTVNGFIKLAIPADCKLDITARAFNENIFSRLENIDNGNTANQEMNHFTRDGDSEEVIIADLESKAGSIYLKDTDKEED